MAYKSRILLVFALAASIFILFGCLGGNAASGSDSQSIRQELDAAPENGNAQQAQPPPQTPQENMAQPPPEKTGKLEIVKTFQYVNSLGFYHITGVAKNTGSLPINHARANVYYYLKDGMKKAAEPVVWPARLGAGETGAFEVTVGQAAEYDIGRFDANAGSFIIDENEYADKFEITKLQPEITDGIFKAFAQIRNSGNAESKKYPISVTYYDADGNVLGIGTSSIGKLGPGESIKVSSTTWHPGNGHRIAGFEMQIEYGLGTG